MENFTASVIHEETATSISLPFASISMKKTPVNGKEEVVCGDAVPRH
jgi:hypothetical protein